MKQQVRLVALLALCMIPMGVMGQVTLVSDNSGNYPGGTWTEATNFGFGLGAWSFSHTGSAGRYIGGTGIGTSFGLYSPTGENLSSATRQFEKPLKAGDQFQVTIGHTTTINGGGGEVGLTLLDGTTARVTLKFAGGASSWSLNDGGSDFGIGQNYSANTGITFTFTYNGGSSYSFSFGTASGNNYNAQTTISNITGVRFFSNKQGDSQNFGFNNISVTNSSATSTLAGSAGWRLLSSPVNGASYSSLLTNIWTQGATGADVSNGTPNVFWSEGSTNPTLNSTNLTDLTSAVPYGRGFAVYVFNDDNYTAEGGTSWPKTLSITGTENTAGGTYTPAYTSGTQYAIAGNPFASTIDWDNVTKDTGVSNSVWVWNPATSTYDAYNTGNGNLTGGLIAPFQGFWMEYTTASSTLTFPAAAKSTGATFRGKEAAPRRLVVRATDSAGSNNAWISFRDGANLGEDQFDAVKFTPLAADYIQMFTTVADKAHDINSLPVDLVDAVEIPLGVTSTRGGAITLDLQELNLPEGWAVSFRDNATGETRAMNADFSYTFESSRAKAAPVGEAPHVLASTAPRFTLIIDPSKTTSVDRGPETVGRMELEQNYPNPFNPSTQIRFTLRTSNRARLTVYDVLGREVAVLVDGTMPAGAHSVTFDASNLTSGVYLYKLEAGGMSTTKRMTLVK